MNTRRHHTLNSIPRPKNILLIDTAQPHNHPNIPIIKDISSYHFGNLFHTIEIIWTRDGKPSLDDVHYYAQPPIFRNRQGNTGGLIPFLQSFVEDADIVDIGNMAGGVCRGIGATV